jgi:hypothetical protein
LIVAAGSGAAAGDVDPWMPETLPGLLRALELGIAQELTRAERDALSSSTHQELRETDPELYRKIRGCYARWTEEWIRHAARALEHVPRRRITRAEQAAAEVDRKLQSYFEDRGWAYRPMKVVFLPRRLMTEPGLPSITARGMYLVYYPELFFASLDPSSTLRHTLIHESLHFNKTGPCLGRTLAEGIAEVAATQLALDWEMVGRAALRDANAYPVPQRAVEYVLGQMARRAGMSREHALDVLLHAYLTGDFAIVERVLGLAAWTEILRASREHGKVRKTARRVLRDDRSDEAPPSPMVLSRAGDIAEPGPAPSPTD